MTFQRGGHTKNQYWPAKYLIDKDGQVRYTHFGEGDYAETEQTIQALLKESGKTVTAKLEIERSASSAVRGQTPETYLDLSAPNALLTPINL
ncbi:hypothetical protein IPL68_06185 [Candidatus Saccharibacteria bacterium]|nr:MAG: hypothetical protein IPL68_06185 [Candidatus Saccharibacteria bacterium]